MTDADLQSAILNSLKGPVLVGDLNHTAIYMNRAAQEHYTGGSDLLGTNLLECHNAQSQKMMIEILAAMHQGLEEQMITDNEKYRVYMRAIRDADGTLLGYYERYEPPREKHTDTSNT
jgi:nitrogen-specific signal transduction histidine kinase